MIIVDTNVVSEAINETTSSEMRFWFDQQLPETLFLTATNLSELLIGAEYLPSGNRKTRLVNAMSDLLERLFGDRILPFDQQAAVAYAPMMARARRAGRAIQVADGQIAAIALVHGFAVATRDTSPFEAAGITVIDPWQEAM